MKKIKRNGGFTLVEVIVVLVILAVMAAILIPSFTGWIDNAKSKECLIERTGLLREYQALAAYSAYSVADDAKAEELLTEGAKDRLNLDIAGSSFTGTCGGTWTVSFAGDYTYITEIVCSEHGSLYSHQQSGLIGTGTTPETLINGAIIGSGAVLTGRTDSTSPTGPNTTLMLNYMKNNGIDLETLNVKSWAIIKEGGANTMWWSDQDISTLSAGDAVRVVRYNPASGTYTAGYATVQKSDSKEYGDYLIFSGKMNASDWSEYAGQNDTTKKDYSATVDIFNSMPETK